MPKIEIRQLQKLVITRNSQNRRLKSHFLLKRDPALPECEMIHLPIGLNQ